jgi:hypothetical protein
MLPLDFFSLREKVAGGRMKGETSGCFLRKPIFPPSSKHSPAEGQLPHCPFFVFDLRRGELAPPFVSSPRLLKNGIFLA